MEPAATIEASPAVEEVLALMSGGRGVIVTRDGRPLAEVRPIGDKLPDRPRGPADIAWIRRHRVGRLAPSDGDSGDLVSRMRDEDWR